jgi:hypothetical protein
VQRYYDEIEEHISDHPYRNIDSDDYRAPIVVQFRNYLEKELSLHKEVKVLHWIYTGQITQSPPCKHWRNYYRKKSSQRTLNFPMFILSKRNVSHHLAVVSSDGSKNIEAIVAALLNIHVHSDGKETNAINRAVSGCRHDLRLPKKRR